MLSDIDFPFSKWYQNMCVCREENVFGELSQTHGEKGTKQNQENKQNKIIEFVNWKNIKRP